MSLFQTSVIKKYVNELDNNRIEQKYQEFTDYFGKPEIQQHILSVNEEQFQVHFFRELFVKILGYDLNDKPEYNLDVEFKNINDSKKADGAILKEGKAIGVIELKSTQTTDLDKVETQAFGYKNHHPECMYVVTSNFEKLRFYVKNAVDFIEFDLFNLTTGDFKLMWLCLEKDNLLFHIPEAMKKASVLKEEDVTKKLYTDYAKFREALFNNMVKNNPETDKLSLFKKTQKLLDRFLFIFFAEDRLLVPPNSITQIIDKWEDDIAFGDEKPLYDLFKQYFRVLNQGRPQRGKRPAIFAYNGGLFKPDELLDSVKIDDDVLKDHSLNLSAYDFETDIDVNILGHIFEHSIGEIESVQAEIKGETQDKTKSRRKKEGVFYTPKYITQYIVENTVGKLCEEERSKLGIVDEEYTKGRKNRKKTKLKELIDKLDAYREWLLQLTILDPACGSGAFLNQALDFLIKEHGKIDELRAILLDESLKLSDITNDILENNIYGVDINDESVEIAKLSLWLRTAAKGRKLNTLSDNIKCGNSLIDDSEIAGDKAFNWKEEFPEVFKKGGFDVVIGNPPYGAKLTDEVKGYIKDNYVSFHNNHDVYSAFIQQAFESINERGCWGFINPTSWQSNENYFKLRKFFKDIGELAIAIKLPYDVFADAYVDTGIYIARKRRSKNYNALVFDFPIREEITPSLLQFVKLRALPSSYWESLPSLKIVLNPSFYELLPKISKDTTPLKDITKSVRGILHAKDDVLAEQEADTKPYFVGDLYRYEIVEQFDYVNYGDNLKEKPKSYDWFLGERILVRRLINRRFRVMASITAKEFVNKKDIYVIKSIDNQIDNHFLLAIINSKLISYLKTKGSATATKDDFSQLTLNDLREIPIKTTSLSSQKDLISCVKDIKAAVGEFQQKKQKFLKRIRANFNLQKLSNKLITFYIFDFKTFMGELKKKKISLSLDQQDEWEDYFDKYKSETNQLLSKIREIDSEIDQMVYELYDLSDEEIKIVEESVG